MTPKTNVQKRWSSKLISVSDKFNEVYNSVCYVKLVYEQLFSVIAIEYGVVGVSIISDLARNVAIYVTTENEALFF